MADELGITAEDADAIRAAAEEFGQNVAYFDAQAAGIKDKHIPNLTEDDARELTTLQKRKEALITSTVASLPAKLGRQLADRLSSYIAGHVKPRVRSFQPPNPAEHLHGLLRQRDDGPPQFVNAVYAPRPDLQQLRHGRIRTPVRGRLAGHDRALRLWAWARDRGLQLLRSHLVVNTRVYNPDGTRSTSQLAEWYRATTSSTTSLPVLADFGDFFIEIEVKEKCPYIFGLIALGVFLVDPPETVLPASDVGFHKVFLQDSTPPDAPESSAFASAVFDVRDSVNFNIKTTLGPDACGGDGFIIQASFVPPPETHFCCALTSVVLSRDNKFQKAPHPITGFTQGIFNNLVSREPFVAVRLKRRKDANGTPSGRRAASMSASAAVSTTDNQ